MAIEDITTKGALAVFIRQTLGIQPGRVRTKPVRYTVATLPAAALANDGELVYVTDGAAGQKLRFSDGANWLNIV